MYHILATKDYHFVLKSYAKADPQNERRVSVTLVLNAYPNGSENPVILHHAMDISAFPAEGVTPETILSAKLGEHEGMLSNLSHFDYVQHRIDDLTAQLAAWKSLLERSK